jgi:hypothetical protein
VTAMKLTKGLSRIKFGKVHFRKKGPGGWSLAKGGKSHLRKYKPKRKGW